MKFIINVLCGLGYIYFICSGFYFILFFFKMYIGIGIFNVCFRGILDFIDCI